MRLIDRFSPFLLLICILTICILLFTRESDRASNHAAFILGSETPIPTYPAETRRYTYVNLRNLSYYKESAPRCDSESPYLLILVSSSPTNFMYRSTIRKTWGSVPKILGHSIRVVFLVGETEDAVESKLHREMEDHQDIVKGNFADTYRNLTYKTLLGYKWSLSNCERASLAMKSDDDVFIDVFRAMLTLTSTFGPRPVNILAGAIKHSEGVHRVGKWGVSREEYPSDFYPDYLLACAHVVSPDIARRMYSAVNTVPFFRLEDVFMTGLLADAAGVVKTDLGDRFQRFDVHLIRWLLGNSTEPGPWIATHVKRHRWPHDIIKLWVKTVAAWNINSIS